MGSNALYAAAYIITIVPRGWHSGTPLVVESNALYTAAYAITIVPRGWHSSILFVVGSNAPVYNDL